jgi:lipoyl(octanoyl) transferase
MVSAAADRELVVYRLGRIDYAEAHALQERLLEARIRNETPDTLLILEHDPVITLGSGARQEHVLRGREELAARGIQVVSTGRGGDVTYHGPGQLVLYPIIDLRPGERDVRRYIWNLEEVMIRVAAAYRLAAERCSGLTGVWVSGRKLGAVGVRIRRWVTMHGLAFNVNTDLDGFDLIVPCGLRGREVTSLQRELGRALDMGEVAERCAETFTVLYGHRAGFRGGRP